MSNTRLHPIRIAVILILIVMIVAASTNPQSVPIRTDLTIENIMGALGGLFILILLIERTTEILVSIGRLAKTDSLKQEHEALSKDPGRASELAEKSKELAIYQTETKQFALLVGFAIAVLTCSGGVGILKAILAMPTPIPPFMRGIDIILTSGLLAGGSDSFHQFVRAIESFFADAKK